MPYAYGSYINSNMFIYHIEGVKKRQEQSYTIKDRREHKESTITEII